MDKEQILEHLAQVERNIGSSECEAARLWQDVTRLERSGDAAVKTRQELRTHEQSQLAHREERARLLAQLSASKAA
ncbi:MAG TPA: hypothetical protein VMF64_10105 [Steroidobacteraceae bacterium]|nr:hypothetical protein [Steroidobacteraceae bacterium]